MRRIRTYDDANAAIWDRSGWDRGFISNPFAGDDAARLGLTRTRLLLDAMGGPDERLRLVHVAGSKGKGSTSTLIAGVLQESGLRTGRFLSPHMHDFRERFAIDGELIPVDEFVPIVAETMDATVQVERHHPEVGTLTAWELSTAIALAWFARRACDAAVIEVGLGGLLDATNVITPGVSVITRLDFEHTAILGNTMSEIATNKAGIIKEGAPVVSVDQPDEGTAVIAQRAATLGSELLVANRDWWATGTWEEFRVEGPSWSHDRLRLTMPGQHQVENAGLAIAATHLFSRHFGIEQVPDQQSVRAGLRKATLPGRFETLVTEAGVQVVLDGAHTAESMRALVQTLEAKFPGREVIAVMGMLAGRDPGDVLPILGQAARIVILAEPDNPRAVPVAELGRGVGAAEATVLTAPNVAEAVGTALATARPAESVAVVTGSFSVVAEARVALGLA